jgi:hypothetical protein
MTYPTYTTLDGKPLTRPQSGTTVVHVTPTISYLLLLDCVYAPPPPRIPGGN